MPNSDKETLVAALSVLINILAQVSQGKKLNTRARSFSNKIINEFKSTYDLATSPEEKKAAKLFYIKKYISALKEKNAEERTKKIDRVIKSIDDSGINEGPLNKHHKRHLHAPNPTRGAGSSSAEALALTRISDLFGNYSTSQYYRENMRWDEVFESLTSFYGEDLDPLSVFSVLFKDVFGLTESALSAIELSFRMCGVSLIGPANNGSAAYNVFQNGEKVSDYSMKPIKGKSLSDLAGTSRRKN